MNFKKNQRRIPMNMKKIIPLSFAALSVAGALSACSDSTVVGADVQGNSIALSSSSGVGPGSSSSFDELNRESSDLMAQLNRMSNGRAVTVYHVAGDTSQSIYQDSQGTYRSIFHSDSVDAYKTYNDIVGKILEDDGVVRNAISPSTNCGFADCNQIYYQTEVAMIDNENNVMRRSILMSYGREAGIERNALHCMRDGSRLYSIDFKQRDSDLVVRKWLVHYNDYEMYEEFKADCALENGEFMDHNVDYPEEQPRTGAFCYVKPNLTDEGVPAYKDANWKKYAKYVIDSCAESISDDE